jgi:dephospho-CoA kinase
MTTVLVTGPIGGGKSTVCGYLAGAGYPVYDCDSRCKALYDKVPGLKERIRTELGVPFEELGRIFSDDALRERLEAMVYPLLIRDIEEWKASQHSETAFIESAVALGKPAFRHLWERVLMVTAPLKFRIRRNPRVAERDALQHFDETQIDYTITNDSDLGSLYSKVDKYLESL